MHWIVCPDRQAQTKACAAIIAAQVLQKPDSVLGFATGSTPLATYRELIDLKRAGVVSFELARTFNLDEYVGLPIDHPQSYYRFMWDNLFAPLEFRPGQAQLPNGMADDLGAECARYEREIESAGFIDLQLLGIGHDGHIGFNEPADVFSKDTHVETLAERTIDANRRFFATRDEVPRTALTMGVGTIMRSRRILLTAFGADKADVIREAFCGPVTPRVTASILQFHADCTIVLDSEAASKL
ncbi:MAG: glucosamine-6-phosphate deaminase [Oscillospiraceae bacterium]|jgi:glucosamine-6-phosphate deaminase|nr:glucosamine-6-phosphate deaminase [Oscillospiraceae bacterium]